VLPELLAIAGGAVLLLPSNRLPQALRVPLTPFAASLSTVRWIPPFFPKPREGPLPSWSKLGSQHLSVSRQAIVAVQSVRVVQHYPTPAAGRWQVRASILRFGTTAPYQVASRTPVRLSEGRGKDAAAAEVGYALHPIDLEPTKAYSPASIGKAYLRAMGIRPIPDRQPDFPKDVLGYAMAAYYGGWAEARIRRWPVPVVYVDFLSTYPTVCCLLGSWRFLTCEHIDVEDITEEFQSMLSRLSLEDCFGPQLWSQLVGLVQVVPDGDTVPVRARYAGDANWPIGINPFTCAEPLWFTIPDIVAGTLRTGRPPRVIKAIRLATRRIQSGLRPVVLRRAVAIDPREQDFFKVVVEERARLKRHPDVAEGERVRLERFLKVLANASSYGIYAEMVREELASGQRESVTVYGLEGEPFATRVAAPEEPGEFMFAPMAACIAGGARLLLTLVERLAAAKGGTFACCDTDSMAVVATEHGGLVPCPGGQERRPDGHQGCPGAVLGAG